jgi:hypothetical protein
MNNITKKVNIKKITLDKSKIKKLLRKKENSKNEEEKFKTTIDDNRFTEDNSLSEEKTNLKNTSPIVNLERELPRITRLKEEEEKSSNEKVSYTEKYSSEKRPAYETGGNTNLSQTPFEDDSRFRDLTEREIYTDNNSQFNQMFPNLERGRRENLQEFPTIEKIDALDYFSGQSKQRKTHTKNPFFEEQEDKYNTIN